jgi:uncharacterized protein
MDHAVDWSAGRWTHPPVAVSVDGTDLLVTAAEGSDAWLTTSYGFVHDDPHALVTPLPNGRAVEVCFTADFADQFDQAGVFFAVSKTEWIKAGVEFADGYPQLGAVVTHGHSDWSVAPVPEWSGRRVTVRASRAGDAVTVRARCEDGPWRLVRLAHLDPDAVVEAGPFCCAPTRAGLVVRFHSWTISDADAALH